MGALPSPSRGSEVAEEGEVSKWLKTFAQSAWESAVKSAAKWRRWIVFCVCVVVLNLFSVPEVLIGYFGCMLAYEIGLFVPRKQG